MASNSSPSDLEDNPSQGHPKPTPSASREVDRALRLLRAKIHDRGFTQLRVQEALGWGRTYISQLLRRQKSLRYDQILQILEVIEIEPVEFFAELFGRDLGKDSQTTAYGSAEGPQTTHQPGVLGGPTLRHATIGPGNLEARDLGSTLSALLSLLVRKGLVHEQELLEMLTLQQSTRHP